MGSPSAATTQGQKLRSSILGALIGLALGAGLLTFALRLGKIGSPFGGQTSIAVDQPTVIRQITRLERLETVSFTMDKIISGAHENAYLPKFLAGDRLLLVIHGEVVAGIDFSKIAPSDVTVEGKTVTIHLPEAEIFTTRIDNARSKVYSRDTGLFSTPDPNLESQVREEAEKQLRQAALQGGVLKTARDNTQGTVRAMLQGLGFREIKIQ